MLLHMLFHMEILYFFLHYSFKYLFEVVKLSNVSQKKKKKSSSSSYFDIPIIILPDNSNHRSTHQIFFHGPNKLNYTVVN